jgi:hypothetical protein
MALINLFAPNYQHFNGPKIWKNMNVDIWCHQLGLVWISTLLLTLWMENKNFILKFSGSFKGPIVATTQNTQNSPPLKPLITLVPFKHPNNSKLQTSKTKQLSTLILNTQHLNNQKMKCKVHKCKLLFASIFLLSYNYNCKCTLHHVMFTICNSCLQWHSHIMEPIDVCAMHMNSIELSHNVE